MIDKKLVITEAMSLGYFRAKSAEKRDAIFEELVQCEELEQYSKHDLTSILYSELTRRAEVAKIKVANAAKKAIEDSEKPVTSSQCSAFGHVQNLPAGKYLLTVAQNNTDVDAVFLESLETYAMENNCRILCAKTTYNKNGFQKSLDNTDGVYYDPKVSKYLVEGQINLGNVAHFVSDANVIVTARNPINGFEAVTPNGVHAIIPASKIALKCTATLKGGRNKILFGTGAVTKRNYILRKAGSVAATEHNIGALFVQITDEGKLTARHLEMMPGSDGFYDEGNYYRPDGSYKKAVPIALQFGDIHAEKMEKVNLKAMIALINKYTPENIFCHDVMDWSSRNHHNIKDCLHVFAADTSGQTVKKDIMVVAQIIDLIQDTNPDIRVHIIESNHDLAINTWLKQEDFKKDSRNAVVYLECMLAVYKHIENNNSTEFNMLKFAYENIGNGRHADKIAFHYQNESVVLAGVEHGCHGHHGSNGARGSPQGFRALGIPLNTGHTHSPSINGACYTAGVSASLYMGYNENGASSWAIAHILTWPNGQRQIIFA